MNELFRSRGCRKNVLNEFYGSSETRASSVLLPPDYEEKPVRYGSVGKIRCAETRVYNKEKNAWCLPGEDGSILNRSLTTLNLNYVGSSERADKAMRFIAGQNWFDDGLQGHMDEDGFLYLTGRDKEKIGRASCRERV